MNSTSAFSRGHSEEEIPVPIPNTEVKLFSAGCTWWATAREIWTLRGTNLKGAPGDRGFSFVWGSCFSRGSGGGFKVVDEFFDASGFAGDFEDKLFFLVCPGGSGESDGASFCGDSDIGEVDAFTEGEGGGDFGGGAGVEDGAGACLDELSGVTGEFGLVGGVAGGEEEAGENDGYEIGGFHC